MGDWIVNGLEAAFELCVLVVLCVWGGVWV